MRLLLKLLLLAFSFFITTQALAQEKLIFAIDIIRHGDRAPVVDVPNASYHWKKEELGQLTARGMQQEYLLGANQRKMYIDTYHLLPPNYSAGTLYVRATDLDRTLMSAQSFLLGLYPLGTGPMLPDSKQPALPSAFQPIPIHTIAQDRDNLLVVPINSPKFQKCLKQYIYSTPEWKHKIVELKPKFAAWSKATGISITDPFQLISIGDTLNVDQLYHVPLPAGLTSEDAKQIIDTRHWGFVTIFKSREIGRKVGNNLLKVIANYFQQASQGKTQLKYVLFSGHDLTQLALLSAMSVPLNEAPPYASDLNFSLFDEGNQQYYVKIRYNGKPIVIPSCGGDTCSLAQFNSLVK